jgi:hypothetical protein
MKLPKYLPELAIRVLLGYIPIFFGLVYSVFGPVYNPIGPVVLYTHGALTAACALLVVWKKVPALGAGYWILWGMLAAGDSLFVLLVFGVLSDTTPPNWH